MMKPLSRNALLALRWTLASSVGGAAGLLALDALVGRWGDGGIGPGMLIAGVLGLAVGLAQALAARPTAYSGTDWVWVVAWSLVSAIGMSLGFALGFFGSAIVAMLIWSIHIPDAGYAAMIALAWLVTALCTSAAQGWLLRRTAPPVFRWFWWGALGWALAGAVIYGVGSLVGGDPILEVGVAGGAGGAVLGAITGAAMFHAPLATSAPGDESQ